MQLAYNIFSIFLIAGLYVYSFAFHAGETTMRETQQVAENAAAIDQLVQRDAELKSDFETRILYALESQEANAEQIVKNGEAVNEFQKIAYANERKLAGIENDWRELNAIVEMLARNKAGIEVWLAEVNQN